MYIYQLKQTTYQNIPEINTIKSSYSLPSEHPCLGPQDTASETQIKITGYHFPSWSIFIGVLSIITSFELDNLTSNSNLADPCPTLWTM